MARGREEILTVDETAKLLKRHPSTIYRRLERGEWAFAWKDRNGWRIEKDKLLEHLRRAPIATKEKAADPMPRASRASFEALLEAEMRRAK